MKCISRGTSAFARDINLDRVVTGHLDFLNLYIFRVENKIPNESNNVWTRKFLNPERKSCGFKNIRIGVNSSLGNSREFNLESVEIDMYYEEKSGQIEILITVLLKASGNFSGRCDLSNGFP